MAHTTQKELHWTLAAFSIAIGEFQKLDIERWAPGDGWARYRVIDAKGQPVFGSQWRTGAALDDAMHFAVMVLERRRGPVEAK